MSKPKLKVESPAERTLKQIRSLFLSLPLPAPDVDEILRGVRAHLSGTRLGLGRLRKRPAFAPAVERRLRESTELYRSLAESMPHMVWETDAHGVIQYRNQAWHEYAGRAPDPYFAKDWLIHCHPDDRDRLRRQWDSAASTDGAHALDLEVRIRRYDGQYRWFRVKGNPVRDDNGTIIKWLGTCTDIDDQKRIQAALRESEQSLLRAQKVANVGSYEYNLVSGDVRWSPQLYEILRLDPTIFTPSFGSVLQYVTAEDQPLMRRVFETAVEKREPFQFEFRFQRADGKKRVGFMQAEFTDIDEHGKPSRLVASVSDITARKEVEWALEQLNRDVQRRVNDLQTLINVCPIGIAIAEDPAGHRVTGNPAFTQITGVSSDINLSLIGADSDKIHAKFFSEGRLLEAHEMPMQYAMRHNADVSRMEIDVIREDASKANMIAYAAPLRDEHDRPRGAIGVFVDVTEHRRAEEELAKAQRLEAIGLLAGGIAHDFNNILTALFGNIALAKMASEMPSPDRAGIIESLVNAESAFVRARDLTQQLLTFSKGGAPIKKTASLGDLLRDTVMFVLRGANLQVDFRIAPDLWPAQIDEGQISQAISNLVVNAREAVPPGGHVRVEAHNTVLEDPNPFGLAAGRYVRLSIKDWGEGIDEQHLARIFDPYFTTKPQGSGLGLATTFSIVKRHGGHITCTSKRGKGSTFYVYLPASEEGSLQPKTAERGVHRGTGRVLLMDDEDSIRQVGSELLTRLGYEVITAADGREAIRLFKSGQADKKRFTAVILDLTVPGGMGGVECLRELKALDPTIKVYVSSGFSTDPVMSCYEDYGFDGVIPKPYRVSDLSEVLSILLTNEGIGNSA